MSECKNINKFVNVISLIIENCPKIKNTDGLAKLEKLVYTCIKVKDIGNFLEIEIDGEESEIDEKKAQCIELLEKIGLSKDNLTNKIWLCDIATGKIKYP